MDTHNIFHAADEHFGVMQEFLHSPQSQRLDLSGVEEYLSTDGRELLRQLLRAHITARNGGDVGPRVVGTDGMVRTHKRLRPRTLITLFGPIVIRRVGYAMPHVSSLFPLDAMLNLPPINISYTLQKHFIQEVMTSSFKEARDALMRWTGVRLSNDHAQQIVHDAAQDFVRFYTRQCAREQVEARLLPVLVLTSDGKGVVVRTQDLRPATRKRALHAATSPQQSVASRPRRYLRRIATVASVYEITRFIRTADDVVESFFHSEPRPAVQRPAPQAKRLWASLAQTPDAVTGQLFDEALQRDPEHSKEWVVLVDGDPHQIQRFQSWAQRLHIPLTIICDIVHVLGYLWKAGAVLQREALIAPWVRDALLRVLLGHSGVVAATMRAAATRRKLSATVREPLDICARYLQNHAPYLRYAQYLKAGYPIATGIIEGGCRYLVKDRMELTGARWSLAGAEALLKLRAVKVSGDFSAYWTFYEQQQYDRIHKQFYQNPEILTQEDSETLLF